MEKIEIIYKQVDALVPYVNNPRNNEGAVDKVASSIKEFGFRVPIVVDEDNVIVTGHTRLLAAKKLGLEEVPTVSATGLTKAQIKAFRLADNKTSEFATWNDEMLKIEFEELRELDFDLSDTGFTDFEIEEIFADGFEDIPDDVEIEKDDGEGEKVQKNSLVFDGHKVPMTEEELDKLTDLYEEYTELQGTNFGFVNYLLERR